VGALRTVDEPTDGGHLLRCMSPEVAHRVISRQCSTSVALGVKRTSTGRQSQLPRSKMDPEQTYGPRRHGAGGFLVLAILRQTILPSSGRVLERGYSVPIDVPIFRYFDRVK
jgi:hypothetical protein